MPDELREPRTSITLPVSAARLVDELPADHPAFNAPCSKPGACDWYRRCQPCKLREKCRPGYTGAVNRSARLEALAYAAGRGVSGFIPALRPTAKAKPRAKALKPKGA